VLNKVFSVRWLIVLLIISATVIVVWSNEKLDRVPAVPEELRKQAKVFGLENIRAYPDQIDLIKQRHKESLNREIKFYGIGQNNTLLPASVLTLSGGGDNGAFSAGLLAGWTAHGDRPTFMRVTGISTGALIAPFAFLGSDYDKTVTQLYTEIDATKVFKKRFFPLAATIQDALSDTDPLYKTISKFVNQDLLDLLVIERDKGRLLVIQTADIDAGAPVYWDITEIAATKHPKAVELIRKILLASASIPLAFPPVFFEVEAQGNKYHEMHVDGGAVYQAFYEPAQYNSRLVLQEFGFKRPLLNVYEIRNARLHPDWSDTKRQSLTIAQKAVSMLISYNGYGDLYRIYLKTLGEGYKFNIAYIKDDFQAEHKDDFDPNYMKALYDYGYHQGLNGYSWDHSPPGISPITIQKEPQNISQAPVQVIDQSKHILETKKQIHKN